MTILLLAACSVATGPELVEDMPPDLRELVEDTLIALTAAMPAHVDCLDALVIDYSWDLDNRAEYRPATTTLILKVPDTAPNLAFSLVHEIAHHLESSCRAQLDLRPAFLEAQGHPPDQPWFDGHAWEDIPSEQFATALARYVTGGREPQRRVPLTDAAVGLVGAWARGELNHWPSDS